MITLYLLGKFVGWAFKICFYMATLPLQLILMPLRGFKSGARRRDRDNDFWIWFI